MTLLNNAEKHLNELENNSDKKTIQKLGLAFSRRVAKRLDEFSDVCETCDALLLKFEEDLASLKSKDITNEVIKEHHKIRVEAASHLGKEHKLIEDGHYMAIYMSLGISLGVVFGLTLFDNLALGIPIGMAIGIGIGSSMDADAKKKGKVI